MPVGKGLGWLSVPTRVRWWLGGFSALPQPQSGQVRLPVAGLGGRRGPLLPQALETSGSAPC